MRRSAMTSFGLGLLALVICELAGGLFGYGIALLTERSVAAVIGLVLGFGLTTWIADRYFRPYRAGWLYGGFSVLPLAVVLAVVMARPGAMVAAGPQLLVLFFGWMGLYRRGGFVWR